MTFDHTGFLHYLETVLSEQDRAALATHVDSLDPLQPISAKLLAPLINKDWPQLDNAELHFYAWNLVLWSAHHHWPQGNARRTIYSSALYLSFYRSPGPIRDDSLASTSVLNVLEARPADRPLDFQWFARYLTSFVRPRTELMATELFTLLGLLVFEVARETHVLGSADWETVLALVDHWATSDAELARGVFAQQDDPYQAVCWRKQVSALRRKTRELVPIQPRDCLLRLCDELTSAEGSRG